MANADNSKIDRFSLYGFPAIAVIVWTTIISSSLTWGLVNERDQAKELARKEALTTFNKDLAFRLWATKHGGVYVPATEQTPHNLYLSHIPERDIVTPSGKKLTLMNPAHMMRQLMEDYSKLYGIKGRITSLNLLNPMNEPDDWEREALKEFERGVEEVFDFVNYENSTYLRLIRPLLTKKGCLKCHGHQGYKVGDVRGGVGVSVPMAPYLEIGQKVGRTIIISHAIIWLLGMLAVFFVENWHKKRLTERKQTEIKILQLNKDLDLRVTTRTAELKRSNEHLLQEITERKRVEEALIKAHDELEKRVDERTAELKLANEQLIHAEKLSAIGKLSASIAHEFNNPLFGIRNVLDGVKRRASLGEDDEELVDMALQECDRIKYLIHDLQDFNRPTSGIMAPMDVHNAINNTMLLLKKELEKKNIRVEKRLASNFPNIRAVADQIKQVLLNLLKNACDAIPDKGGTITITTEVMDEQVAIHIQDSGVGIAPQDMDHVFEPFFTTKPEVKGTGLGLSVSYGIIKRHSGRIDIKSEPGHGAAFIIILPIDGANK